jgi:hypothetical protein
LFGFWVRDSIRSGKSHLIQYRIAFGSCRPVSHPRGGASAQAQFLGKQQSATKDECILDWVRDLRDIRSARMIHENGGEAFETEARLSFSQVRPKAFGREDGQRTHQRVGLCTALRRGGE